MKTPERTDAPRGLRDEADATVWIAKHRGLANRSPIVLRAYPIDPWPGEPLPDEYDLLIYAKNG